MIKFACISPHPPLLLPGVVPTAERNKVKKTIESLEFLGGKLKETEPKYIIISSPHPDWGFNVPLYFLAGGLKAEIKTFLTGVNSPNEHYEEGRVFYENKLRDLDADIALIASGDLSHRLTANSPYGYHEQGPEFDKTLIDSLKNKDTENILNLDSRYPEAGECGLRSFCFLLGILDAAKIGWKAEILSYEGPFGVGYLVADLMPNIVS